MSNINEIDLTGDGVVSEKELELYEKRAKNRRRMAWVSLIAMVLSAFALMFFVPDERLTSLDGLLELYWIALGGVVGAYVGISSWTRKG
jgi:hypothetical protein